MTIISMPVIPPHLESKFFLESRSRISKFCRVLWIIIVISIVVFFNLRVVVLRRKVEGVINTNEIVQDCKCWHKLCLYSQRVFRGQQKNTKSSLEEAKDVVTVGRP
jgi:hypothetical protein